MEPIKWYFDSIHLQNYSHDILNEWFDREKHQFISKYYWEGVKFHPGNITQFTQEDYRNNPQRLPKFNWRKKLARRLFGLRKAAAERFTSMTRGITTHDSLYSAQANRYWLASNCRPHYGKWHMLNKPANPRNPLGKMCENRYCPWCYLRRFDYIYRTLAASPEIIVKDYRGRQVNGIGPYRQLNLLTFDILDDPRNKDFWAHFVTVMATKSRFGLARYAVDLALLASKGWLAGMFLTPLYAEPDDETVFVGVRIGFLFQGDIDRHLNTAVCREIVDGNPDMITLRHEIPLADALRFVMPYPVDFLRSDPYTGIKLNLGELFEGTTTFRKGLAKPKEAVSDRPTA